MPFLRPARFRICSSSNLLLRVVLTKCAICHQRRAADCGASAGSEPIWTAIEELKEITGATKVNLAGLRLGANLSARVAAYRPKDVSKLVLWEPLTADELAVAGFGRPAPGADGNQWWPGCKENECTRGKQSCPAQNSEWCLNDDVHEEQDLQGRQGPLARLCASERSGSDVGQGTRTAIGALAREGVHQWRWRHSGWRGDGPCWHCCTN
jgi:pimeloyl-ACP methyl ester carboxylesterase